MSMSIKFRVNKAHEKNILAIAYNIHRREIYTASEETAIKVWEADTGKYVGSLQGHLGWVTALLYCKELKTLFSCSIDGRIIAWSSGGKILQKIDTKMPLYGIVYNPSKFRAHIIVSSNSKIKVFPLLSLDQITLAMAASGTTDLIETKGYTLSEHTDVIRCIECGDGRLFTAGYDRKLTFYDCSGANERSVRVTHAVDAAHEAAITCMVYAKESESTWIATGSYDRLCKIWSIEGNLLHRFEGFADTISTVTYIPPLQALWVSSHSASPVIFDPRTGIDITAFVSSGLADEISVQMRMTGAYLKQFAFFPEANEVIAATSRRGFNVYKYESFAAQSTLEAHQDVIHALCTTSGREPVLIFSGGADGVIRKWERLQLSTTTYAQEPHVVPSPKTLQADAHAYLPPVHTSRHARRKKFMHRHFMTVDERTGERQRQSELMTQRTQGTFNRKERALEYEARKAGIGIDSALSSDARLREEEYNELREQSGMIAPQKAQAKLRAEGRLQAEIDAHEKAIRPVICSMVFQDALQRLVTGLDDGSLCTPFFISFRFPIEMKREIFF